MEERKLATMERILDIQPIPNADAIEVATVKGWKVVVKKGDFKIGDLCIYVEIDSILDPENPEFQFMAPRRFRVKTIKLRGQISQGIVFPISILGTHYYYDNNPVGEFDDEYCGPPEGVDYTKKLKIVKHIDEVPANLAGRVKGNFPAFIPKTDEERIQNLSGIYENLKKHKYVVTEKLDGSSFTCYLNNGDFGVCSRNIDLLETPENTFWRLARELELERLLREYSTTFGGSFALQGELLGNGIQKNKYNYAANAVRFFNVFHIDNQVYEPMWMFKDTIESFGLKTVPILDEEYTLPDTMEELIKFAEGKSELNKSTEREGLVLRNPERTISFKVISNKFLLKNDE